MGKRTRQEIYDPYPIDAIEDAINKWVKHHLHRRILHYILVDGYTYEETANLIAEETGVAYDAKKMYRTLVDAENELFPYLKHKYPQYNKD